MPFRTTIFLTLLPFFLGCQSLKGKSSPTAAPSHKDQTLINNEDLFQALYKNTRFRLRQGQEETIRVFDLTCGVALSGEGFQCSGYDRPEVQAGARRFSFEPTDSEQIFSALSLLPIAKGDSGLFTEAILCRKFHLAGDNKLPTYCAVMMPIENVPQSSLPSGF